MRPAFLALMGIWRCNREMSTISDIHGFKDWRTILPIEKGWSSDKKYFVESIAGKKLLLRISEISDYDKKKDEFEILEKLVNKDMPIPRPIEFGVCNNGNSVYSLLTWMDGEDAESVIPSFNESEQYNLGVKAGQVLFVMHSFTAPKGLPSWEQRILNKVKVKYAQYESCGIKVPHDDEILKFINDNLWCTKNVQRTFCHGDFHLGNMIIDKDREINIIDFNRWGYDDPYEEFNRLMVFTRRISIPFAKGQIHGYFDGEQPPEAFFRRMALYTAINALFSIVWSIPFGEEEIKGDLERSRMNYEDYNGFTTIIPNWWRNG